MNRNSRFVIVAASALCASLVPVASVGQTTEQEHSESILDEIADDTATKRTGSPKPVGPARQHPPSNPMPPGFHMYQELESLSLSLSSAVRACDRKAFDETKAELLAAIDRSAKLEELTDQDKTSLRVRREQAENTRFPDPCPPVTSSAPVHQPPVVRPSPAPAGTVASPASPPTLVEQARTALIEHAAAVGRCDRTKMISYLFLLDALVSKALNESMEFTGSPFTVEEERRKAVLVEIMSHRDAALKRQADCPKEPRVALNPQEQIFLDSHNAERRLVGVPPMQWDPALAAGAKAYAIKLTSAGQLVHSSREGRKDIRENLLQSLPGRTPQQMFGVWSAEKRHFKTGIFPDVSKTGNWYDVGHYTQVVWEKTTHVGCATHGDARFTWLVCHYRPGGNRDGTAMDVPPPM